MSAGLGFLCSRGCGCVACRGPLPGEVSLFLQISWLVLSLSPSHGLLSLCFSEVLTFVLTFLQ